VLLALGGLPVATVAQNTAGGSLGSTAATTVPVDPAAPRAAYAARATGSPRIDGRLDDEAWTSAIPIADFWQVDPDEGEPASEPTEARVLYDDHAIYIGIRAWDSQADQITARLTRRDEDSFSDWLIVAIDSYHDHRTGYAFFVNPAGVKRDAYLFDDGNDDDSWNAVWDVEVSRDPDGWSAEFRIPWSQLRFAKQESNDFGSQILRTITRLNEGQHAATPRRSAAVRRRRGRLHARGRGQPVSDGARRHGAGRCGPQRRHHEQPDALGDDQPRLRPG
jgi:hypothetical protein